MLKARERHEKHLFPVSLSISVLLLTPAVSEGALPTLCRRALQGVRLWLKSAMTEVFTPQKLAIAVNLDLLYSFGNCLDIRHMT